jgi:CheY-like chemotaxis protein
VRALAARILGRQGYRVLEEASGPEALARLATEPRVDLLLTDVVLPGMSGPEFARAAMKLVPGAKVLYMSGYTRDAVVHSGRLEPGIALLEKPFTPDGLARQVREVLDADSAERRPSRTSSPQERRTS